MATLYVCGHQNPDTDSIVAAIAYAALKRELGEPNTEAVRLGAVNSETAYVLQRFGFEPPMLLKTARAQVMDIIIDTPPYLHMDTPMRSAWENMSANSVETLPIVDDNGFFLGLCTSGNITNYNLKIDFSDEGIKTSTKNICQTLSGRLVSGTEGRVSGTVRIALEDSDFHRHTGILAARWHEGIEEKIASTNASCLILCQASNVTAINSQAKIIATSHDVFRAAKLASQSTPVSSIMSTQGIISFTPEDYLDDVKKKLTETRHRSYPVLTEDKRVIGAISRYHLINHNRKRIILVDHNEKQQSLPGLEQADVVEIIDHHRLGDVQTGSPMYFRNEPVGSTTTIVAGMYQEFERLPGTGLAGLMLAGILSDTVLFKSPTCTEKDRRIASWLSKIAQVDAMEMGRELYRVFDEKLLKKSAEELFFQDFKEYTLGGKKIGVGQITCFDATGVDETDMQNLLERLHVEERFDLILFMQTDIVHAGTLFYHAGNDLDIIERIFDIPYSSGPFFLSGVMSRKKQVIPALSRFFM